MLLYERKQFFITLPYFHGTFRIWNSCDLLYTVSCYKCFWQWFIALCTSVEACFFEESIDSLSIFNLGFCLVTFDFWSVESLKEEGDFLRVSCFFLINSVIRLYLDLMFWFLEINFSWIRELGIGLWWFYVSFSYFSELHPKTANCKACNKFKLHLSSPTKMDSHKFQNYPHA